MKYSFFVLGLLVACGQGPSISPSSQQSSALTTLVINESANAFDFNGDVTVSSTCPAGTALLAAGVFTPEGNAKIGELALLAGFTGPTGGSNGGSAYATAHTEGAERIVSQAICGNEAFPITTSASMVIPPGGIRTLFAECPAGQTPIAVGFRLLSGQPAGLTLNELAVFTDGTPRVRAQVQYSAQAPVNATVVAQAVCAQSRRVLVVDGPTISVSPGDEVSGTAMCPSGSILIGSAMKSNGSRLLMRALHNDGGDAAFRAKSIDVTKGNVNAQALCLDM